MYEFDTAGVYSVFYIFVCCKDVLLHSLVVILSIIHEFQRADRSSTLRGSG